jgi:hypothetical protein
MKMQQYMVVGGGTLEKKCIDKALGCHKNVKILN